MKNKKYKIHKIAKFFLSFFLNHSHPDEMLGDFDEIYCSLVEKKGKLRAGLWYLFQIILAIPPFFNNSFYWSSHMFKNYLKIAFRNILKNKSYSFINITGLATGMAISILIFTWILDEISYDKFHKNNERIYRITQKHDDPNAGYTPHFARCSFNWLKELPAEIPEIDRIIRFGHRSKSIKVDDKKFNVNNFFVVDSTVFEIFDFPLITGNPKTALINPNSVVITNEIAEKFFGSQNPVGKTMEAYSRYNHKGQVFTVTGIMENIPINSHFHPQILAAMPNNNDEGNWYYTYALLKQGSNIEEIQNKFFTLIQNKMGEQTAKVLSFPFQKLSNIHLHSNINRELETNGNIIHVYAFSAIAILVLLIASINFMNLSTAQWSKRAKEVGIRKVLGSKRRQLISYFLGESMLFSIAGFIIAIILSIILLPIFNELTGKILSLSIKNNWSIYLLLSFVVLITGLVSGSYPAVYLSSFNPVTVLKSGLGTNLNASGSKLTLRKILVVLQFTISITLIISTIVINSQLKYIQNRNIGLNSEQTIVIKNIPNLVQDKYMTYKNEVLKIPGVTGVSAAIDEPSKQILDAGVFEAEGIQQDDENRKVIYPLVADGNIIDFFSMEMAAGEKFTSGQWNDSIDTYILNETAVKTIGWKEPQEAIGKTFEFKLGGVPKNVQPKKGKIIGVVKDFNFSTLHNKIKPLAIFKKSYWVFCILAKVQPGSIQESIAAIEQKWNEMFPQYPFEYSFVDDLFLNLYLSEQKQGKIVSIFSALAVFIACLGLFGLTTFTAEQRTKEIGIRKVMGASVSQIILLLSKEFTKWIIFANIISWPIAMFILNLWLDNFAYKIELELWMFIFSGSLTLFIALLTIIFQAIKAAISNPVKALKYE